MPRQTQHIDLPSPGPGTSSRLTVHRYGTPGARPKAYLQASLHADEIPAMLVLHHLLQMLEGAEILGEIVAVPYANPIGLTQFVNGEHLGRFALAGSGNFNRAWPDLLDQVDEQVAGKLGVDGATNVALIRQAVVETLSQREAASQLDAMRLALSKDAADADIVFDMHCDDEALLHLYAIPEQRDQATALAADMGCEVILLNGPSGGDPFEEVWSTLWTRLAERHPDHPIPPACFATTLEYRGTGDVSDAQAKPDAEALFRHFQRVGLVGGAPDALPDTAVVCYDLNAVDVVRTAGGGILSYRAALGETVEPGQVIADLIDPGAADPTQARSTVACQGGGVILSLKHHKYVSPGTPIAKIAGHDPLDYRTGNLMSD
ncbi:MAG: succinylglutamate desuccinylase/aspartoacylase family protein [Pseudomonadota bacterium]